ncbi:MAG: two-component system response regulator [Thermoleophilia bacterium]|nr:two-component system response regulator [Thermoleophilia bacterium]
MVTGATAKRPAHVTGMLPDMSASPHPLIRPLGSSALDTDGRPPAVLLVDDHDLFRAGLRTLLEGQGLRVVGDSRCEPGAVDMGRRTRASVVLVDTNTVDGTSTVPLVTSLAEGLEDAGIVMFTRSSERVDVYGSVRAGARGYVTKDAPVEHLTAAIRAVAAGNAWLQPPVIATVLDFIRSGNVPIIGRSDMSSRELEVLRLVAVGHDNNEIAAVLGISGKTVKNHVSSILTKLELTNRVQAAVYAVRTGIA